MTILSSKNLSISNKCNAYCDINEKDLEQSGECNNNFTIQTNTVGRRRKCVQSEQNTKDINSALQDRESILQNLRIQLCLGKLPRPTEPPLTKTEKPAAQQKLQKLKTEVENKKIKIRNLKTALEKLNITDNIDIHIRQAELEYSLGREELQLLSLVEEAKILQARLEKSEDKIQSLYSTLVSGLSPNLFAIEATTGRWAAHEIPQYSGIFFIEWALEGDGLYKGDRILEINGQLLNCKTKEELQKLIGNTGKCQMVVLRVKSALVPLKQPDRDNEDNLRLQHRISYLEEQVKELQEIQLEKQLQQQQQNCTSNGHITSISITSPPTTPPDKPMIFQRGNYITTLIGGKPIELSGDEHLQTQNRTRSLNKSKSAAHITKTFIHENGYHTIRPNSPMRKPITNIAADEKSPQRKPSFSSQANYALPTNSFNQKTKDKQQQLTSQTETSPNKSSTTGIGNNRISKQSLQAARSVENLHQQNRTLQRERDNYRNTDRQTLRSCRLPTDTRSVKSLDFHQHSNDVTKARNCPDGALTEFRSIRPTPPKKPLRLSLQRAQSLQTVQVCKPSSTLMMENDRKKAKKRTHITENLPNAIDEDNNESTYTTTCNDDYRSTALQKQQHHHHHHNHQHI